MSRRWIVGLALAGLALGSTAAIAPATAQQRTGSWTISTTSASKTSAYSAVSVSGIRNAWAVGAGPTVSRWDGTRWITLPTPRFALPKGAIVDLGYVVTVSPSDTWVSGTRPFGSRSFQPVYAHWFHGRWYTHVLPADNLIEHISVFGRNDVWLLGTHITATSTVSTTVAWHWNGVSWTRSSLPGMPTIFAGNDQHWVGAVDGNNRGTLLHYVGGRWVVDTSLRRALPARWTDFSVGDVLQRSANDVYATVGPVSAQSSQERGLRLYHWNGRTWTVVISLPKDGPGQLTNDGYGGVWTFSHGVEVSARVIDIRGGEVVASTTQPRFSTGRFAVGDLTLQPGTRILWAAGATANLGNTVTHATVAAYRP